jgi:transposase
MDANQNEIPEALTPKGNRRMITVNAAWEYHKANMREKFSKKENRDI